MPRLRTSGDSLANPWVAVGLAIQLGAAVAFLYGFWPFVFGVAILVGIGCLIGGGDWALRGSAIGILLVLAGVGSPAFMLWYPSHLGHFVREHIVEYQAAVPLALAADKARCRHKPEPLDDWCQVRDLLPSEVRCLARSIHVQYSEGKPVVFFHLIPGRIGTLVYAPGWPATLYPGSPYRSLGDGWHTTLPRP
jgi:hypothetical protein